MDWPNERYVRVYTRDTVTWSLWPWEARALFCLLLRKMDRAGVLDIGEHAAKDAIAVVVNMPPDVVERGLAPLCAAGTVVVNGSCVIVPGFMDAQEARASGAQRQREYMARRRDTASQTVTKGDETSRIVTDNDALVTPSLAEPSPAKPIGRKTPRSRSPKSKENPRVDDALAILHGGRSRIFADTKPSRDKAARALVSKILDEYTLADVQHVVDIWVADCRKPVTGDYDPKRYFVAKTVFTMTGFGGRVDQPAPGASNTQTTVPAAVYDEDPDE